MPGPAPRHVAIVPWGDVVEDFLDPIGRTLDDSTGTPLMILPSPRRYRLARRLGATHLAPYLATPLGALTRALRAEGCDAILCQEYEWARLDACVAVGTRLGLPVFATFQGGDFQASRWEALVRPMSMARAAGFVIAAVGERERERERYVPRLRRWRT